VKRLNIIKTVAIAGILLAGIFPLTAASNTQLKLLDVENKICPVSGDDVSGKHYAAYEGKRYAFCCNQCIKKFNRNPEKYIANLPAYDDAQHSYSAHDAPHHHSGGH